MTSTPTVLTDEEEAMYQACQVFAHRVRIRVLIAFLRHQRWSSVRLADHLDLPAQTVRYHVRQLANAGMIDLVGKVEARGAMEHIYELSLATKRTLTLLQIVARETGRHARPPLDRRTRTS
jgi:predicted ArsR family transcriptional regulator